ncbi:type III secretion protein L [Pseudomonas sp. NFACC02]|uniref:type III secretion system stator protein SctL n=1 Tax=Pseudomonas sp. NFACC02 TaxID=1566250 RepID=UPI0008D36926|nr:type III secretion system stator protein SctL [Pseudomonas sp. NFACC02]SEP66046.1 type III secretion protein L [Pseudomonas sp. NFACC02]
MLAKRRLVLSPSTVLIEPLLRREDIADIQLASEVLSKARREAVLILEDARLQAQQEKDQALGQFWANANQFLHGLDQERQALQRESMAAVEALLTRTLSRLLDDSTLAERTRALVRHLADSQPYEAQATLGAHPEMLDDLRHWLAQSRFAEHWQLKADPTLAPQSLRLSDANGAFDVDWTRLRRGLLGVCGGE